MPALGSQGMALGNMRSGRERLPGETEDDKIKVQTRVEVSISQGGRSPGGNDSIVKDDRESSTESLFRDGKYSGVHIV
jgi:hypothetical protein